MAVVLADYLGRRAVVLGVVAVCLRGGAVPVSHSVGSGAGRDVVAGSAPALALTRTSLSIPSSTPVLALRNVTVIDVVGRRRLAGQTVVIAGSRIRRLGPSRAVPLPAGARVVEARGKYLIPGLWDMHIHLAWGLGFPESWAVMDHQTRAVFYQLLANGVTGIRDAGSAVPLDTFRLWKRELAAGRRIGPRFVVSGKYIYDSSAGAVKWDKDVCRPTFFAQRPYTACGRGGWSTAAGRLVQGGGGRHAEAVRAFGR